MSPPRQTLEEKSRERLAIVRKVVQEQEQDEQLWFDIQTPRERALEGALRRIHAAILGDDAAVASLKPKPHVEKSEAGPGPIACYFACFERDYGFKAVGVTEGVKDALIKKMKQIPAEERNPIVEAFFADHSNFLKDRYHPLGILVTQIDVYRGRARSHAGEPGSGRRERTNGSDVGTTNAAKGKLDWAAATMHEEEG